MCALSKRCLISKTIDYNSFYDSKIHNNFSSSHSVLSHLVNALGFLAVTVKK